MHSIAMPSSLAVLTISSFITSPPPCCPFLPLVPLQSPLEKTRYPDATSSEIPSLLVSCSPITSQPFAAQGLSRVLMWPLPLTPLTAAVRMLNVPNVSSSSHDLALAVLCCDQPKKYECIGNTLKYGPSSHAFSEHYREICHLFTATYFSAYLTPVCPPSFDLFIFLWRHRFFRVLCTIGVSLLYGECIVRFSS